MAVRYADVVHEVKRVESGYRLVLTYNLVRTSRNGPMSAEVLKKDRSKIQDAFAQWGQRFSHDQPQLDTLVYMFDHKYSKANLCYDKLKGRDAVIGRLLKEVCEAEDFVLMFGILEKVVSGITSDNEWGGDDYEDDIQEEISLTNWTQLDGSHFLGQTSLIKSAIIQDSPWGDYDERQAEETGNEGTDITHIYRDAVSKLFWGMLHAS